MFNNPGGNIVNQRVKVGESGFLQIGFSIVHFFLKDVTELTPISFGNGVFGGKPKIYIFGEAIGDAGSGKITDRFFRVVNPLDDPACIFEFVNGLSVFL